MTFLISLPSDLIMCLSGRLLALWSGHLWKNEWASPMSIYRAGDVEKGITKPSANCRVVVALNLHYLSVRLCNSCIVCPVYCLLTTLKKTLDLLMQRCSCWPSSQYTADYDWKPHLLLCAKCLLLFIHMHECTHTLHWWDPRSLLAREINGNHFNCLCWWLIVVWGTSQLYAWNMQFILK